MEYVYAGLLLHEAGTEINEDSLTRTLQVAGAQVERTRVKSFLLAIEEVDITDAIEMPIDGNEKVGEYVLAALLLYVAETKITKEALTKTLRVVGVEVDHSRVEAVKTVVEDSKPFEAMVDPSPSSYIPNSLVTDRHVVNRCGWSPPADIPSSHNLSITYEELNPGETIGTGGNANVTKATLSTTKEEVTLAIKEPRIAGTLSTEQREKMLEEAETWNKLDDHDHIVGVVDYGKKPTSWIAMEYMDGGHLGERSDNMDMPQALWTAIATTKGVRHAHRRGIAHLDLKPENILFRTVGESWDIPKVADWGLSKHLLEHSKSIDGYTPTYSAPEQFDDEYGQTDDITDVYQLGAVFYELFTGHPPFEGDKTREIIRQVLNEEPIPPTKKADVSEALEDILLRALSKEKNDRYDDIIYLRDDLQELDNAIKMNQ